MNIQDVDKTIPILPVPQLLGSIFDHQIMLMEKYKEIEGLPDWPLPFQSKESQVWFKSFLWRTHEELCEAVEALRTCPKIEIDPANLSPSTVYPPHVPNQIVQHITHFFEEISDAIHFLVELMVLADVPFTSMDGSDLLTDLDARSLTFQNIGETFFTEPNSVLFDAEGNLKTSGITSTVRLVEESYGVEAVCKEISYRLGLAGNVLKFKTWKQTQVMSDDQAFRNRIREALSLIFEMLMDCGFLKADIYQLYMAKNQVNQWRQKSNY